MAELDKTYKPSAVEPAILERWLAAKAFHAEPTDPGKPYCIVIPPPNVTAALHLGHALNNTLQDILVRWRRMCGDNALWMPGTDHAGIATQTVVEKRVLAEEGKKRTDFERDAFVAKIQAWKDEYEAVILGQLRKMGCSCDWDRTRFTMDEVCARAVREAFFRLFKDGLIYRGKRLVNWDPVTQTALADDEVEMVEVDGHFYYLRYPLADGSGHVTVATTRPETMLGDTAVAVNPKDPRAAGLIGKMVRLPIVNRRIPIIPDEYVVLPDPNGDEKAKFSSGFLKVTPAHDFNDWELGQKHLEEILMAIIKGNYGSSSAVSGPLERFVLVNVLSPAATISKDHGWPSEEWSSQFGNEADFLLGMDRFEARKAIVEWFRKENLLEEIKPYRHSVGHSYRSHVPIEPYLSDQWYVRVTDPQLSGAALRAMAQRSEPSLAAAESRGDTPRLAWEGKLRFIPERYAKTFEQWHLNIRDWCISRQLWWGHRIPVWSPPRVGPVPDPRDFEAFIEKLKQWESQDRIAQWLRYMDPAEMARDREYRGVFVCVRRGDDYEVIRELERWGYTQDPDVLDTWFSSGLWPLSTLGWPEDTPELKTWNPTNVLCTAREIITLWVSRMVMMNTYFLDRLPFTDVFIHAMIQDGEGRKMSKSLGNGVDPLDIIESHGSDAMRFTLAQMTTHTQDVRLPVVRDEKTGKNTSPKFDLGRNFANKIWNAVRFALSNLTAGAGAQSPAMARAGLSLADRWVLSRLTRTIQAVDNALVNYEFSNYAQTLYDFVWRDFCDWYLEAIKPTVKDNPAQQRVLAACIDASLRLLHPVMPFITEKLWEALGDVAPERSIDGLSLPVSPGTLCVRAAWPQADASLIDEQVEKDFELLQQIVGAIREARTTYKVPPRQKVDISGKAASALAQRALSFRETVETLTNCVGREIGPRTQKPDDAATAIVGGQFEIYLHGLINKDEERARLTKRRDELNKSIAALQGRLANKSYVERAPAKLVEETREQLAGAQRELTAVMEQLKGLGA